MTCGLEGEPTPSSRLHRTLDAEQIQDHSPQLSLDPPANSGCESGGGLPAARLFCGLSGFLARGPGPWGWPLRPSGVLTGWGWPGRGVGRAAAGEQVQPFPLAVPAFGQVQGDMPAAVPGGAGGDRDQVPADGGRPGLRERQAGARCSTSPWQVNSWPGSTALAAASRPALTRA